MKCEVEEDVMYDSHSSANGVSPTAGGGAAGEGGGIGGAQQGTLYELKLGR